MEMHAQFFYLFLFAYFSFAPFLIKSLICASLLNYLITFCNLSVDYCTSVNYCFNYAVPLV